MVSFEVSKFYCGTFVTIHRDEPKPPPPHPLFILHLHLDAIVGLPREGHEKGQQLRGSPGFHTSAVGQEHSKTPGSPHEGRQLGEGVVEPNVRLIQLGHS